MTIREVTIQISETYRFLIGPTLSDLNVAIHCQYKVDGNDKDWFDDPESGGEHTTRTFV